MSCLSSLLGYLILYGHVEGLYYLESVNLNPSTHRPFNAVRLSMGTWGTHADTPHSGSAYYLMVTTVVLFSVVAVTSRTVCKRLAS